MLVDEIDRADAEFEAFLLEVLSDYQVSVPEVGTLRAVHVPLVVLTSNNTRDLSEALKRRCLYLFIDYPTLEQELRVVRLKVPGLAEDLARQAVELVQRLRQGELRKAPSISETLDWARSLVALNARALDAQTLERTLTVLLKHEADLRRAQTLLAMPRRASPRAGPRDRRSPGRGRESRMEERILRFIGALRASGVRVSLAESADGLRAVRAAGVGDRNRFRVSLRAALIKERRGLAIFDQLFPVFFDHAATPLLPDVAGDLSLRKPNSWPKPCASSASRCGARSSDFCAANR